MVRCAPVAQSEIADRVAGRRHGHRGDDTGQRHHDQDLNNRDAPLRPQSADFEWDHASQRRGKLAANG
jgi:hypothetical protein